MPSYEEMAKNDKRLNKNDDEWYILFFFETGTGIAMFKWYMMP